MEVFILSVSGATDQYTWVLPNYLGYGPGFGTVMNHLYPVYSTASKRQFLKWEASNGSMYAYLENPDYTNPAVDNSGVYVHYFQYPTLEAFPEPEDIVLPQGFYKMTEPVSKYDW
ncbi:hypothetical protein SAMN04489743_2853 [Pseudarthrobacter equi]|uniref:Uncharacterized protein n=1 Tax=Pseudarthrobacter equi TaxID=728066 RepID=A0A1H2A968_9MICC|nr:hypothetical protein SAMN04489743_2853 [Pseudarthrobacter equi]